MIFSRKLYKTQLSGANKHKKYMFFSRKYSFIALTGENNEKLFIIHKQLLFNLFNVK